MKKILFVGLFSALSMNLYCNKYNIGQNVDFCCKTQINNIQKTNNVCGAKNKSKGGYCKRKVKGGGYCWQHK